MSVAATMKKYGIERMVRFVYKDPESAEHLCAKCDAYAEFWRPQAETLWAESHK